MSAQVSNETAKSVRTQDLDSKLLGAVRSRSLRHHAVTAFRMAWFRTPLLEFFFKQHPGIFTKEDFEAFDVSKLSKVKSPRKASKSFRKKASKPKTKSLLRFRSLRSSFRPQALKPSREAPSPSTSKSWKPLFVLQLSSQTHFLVFFVFFSFLSPQKAFSCGCLLLYG